MTHKTGTVSTLVALALVVGCGNTTSNSTTGKTAATGSSPWTKLVDCLKQHPLFGVQTGTGMNGAGSLPVGGIRRNLSVIQNVTGHFVASIGDYATSKAANAAARDYNAAEVKYGFRTYVSRSLGYQFTKDADTTNKSDVLNCVNQYP